MMFPYLFSPIKIGVTEIKNRVFRTADGSICGSPDLVRIGFGSTQRMTFLVQPAADDDCVHRQMLDHREAHARAWHDTIQRFIDEQQGILQQGMTALKKTPAPSAKAVEDQWNAGLQLVVSVARQRLITEMRAASARVDDGSVLTDLANSCDGKIRRLDQDLEMNP